jgi:tryptophan synthase beta subunit
MHKSSATTGLRVNRYGRYGEYGGRFVPETLIPALDELARAFAKFRRDCRFREELTHVLREYAGRPTPITFVQRFSAKAGVKMWLKREDLLHTGAHKLNNTLGQILLARRMGKKRIIAETGAGQHGLATATVAAKYGLECVVYMGSEDVRRQALNVYKMRLLGAEVRPVESGTRTLKDATNEAMRDWVTNVESTFYIIGSVVGPYPYPEIVRVFQSVIGSEARSQFKKETGRLPGSVIACVGGGSNAIGIFDAFLKDRHVALYGVEAAGCGTDTHQHAATLGKGRPGVLHGSYSYLLQTDTGQVATAHSISAGLDYPGVGPQHSYLRDSGRVVYDAVTDAEALSAFKVLSETEGIIPALESAHALAYVLKAGKKLRSPALVCLSGRGDKDMDIVREALK